MNPPTLRDYFAAAALQGLVARDALSNAADYAEAAYYYADAMIKESEKKNV